MKPEKRYTPDARYGKMGTAKVVERRSKFRQIIDLLSEWEDTLNAKERGKVEITFGDGEVRCHVTFTSKTKSN